jgi:hypothetical protein
MGSKMKELVFEGGLLGWWVVDIIGVERDI